MKLIKVFGIQKLHWQNLKIVRYSGCLNAKPDVLNTYQAIKSALLSNKNIGRNPIVDCERNGEIIEKNRREENS